MVPARTEKAPPARALQYRRLWRVAPSVLFGILYPSFCLTNLDTQSDTSYEHSMGAGIKESSPTISMDDEAALGQPRGALKD